jgi:Lon protease-like protein
VDDETFVNFLAQHLDVQPLEKQALLEALTLEDRARRLLDTLVFRLEELRTGAAGPPRAH